MQHAYWIGRATRETRPDSSTSGLPELLLRVLAVCRPPVRVDDPGRDRARRGTVRWTR